jgi:hypothetical protein
MSDKAINTDELNLEGDKGFDAAAIAQAMKANDEKLTELQAALAGLQDTSEVDAMKSTIAKLQETVGNLPGSYKGITDKLSERIDELQTDAALATSGKANVPEGIKAITAAIEESEIFESIKSAAEQRSPSRIATPHSFECMTGDGMKMGSFSDRVAIQSLSATGGYKAANPVTIAQVSGQQLTAYRPGVFSDQRWEQNIASRIPVIPVANASVYTIPKETEASKYGAWSSTLTVAVDGDPTPKSTATVQDNNGVMVGSTHRFYNSSDVLLGTAVVVSFVTSTGVITYATDSLTFDAAIGARVVSDNYAVTAENTTKPSGAVGDKAVSFNLKMLASLMRHLLYGDDSADELQGFRTYTGAQTYAWSGGVVGDNKIDAIMKAANLIPWTSGIGVVMKQSDLPGLTLLKDSTGNYLTSGNFGMVPLEMVGGSWFLGPFELVFDYANAATHFTVVNWADASEIADQATAALMWGYIGNDFADNVIRARYEATLAHAIKSTQAYVVGTWDTAPS